MVVVVVMWVKANVEEIYIAELADILVSGILFIRWKLVVAIAGLCFKNLDDNKDKEDAEPNIVIPELGAKQADRIMVSSGEGKV